MILVLKNSHTYVYEIHAILSLFFIKEQINYIDIDEDYTNASLPDDINSSDILIVSLLSTEDGKVASYAACFERDQILDKDFNINRILQNCDCDKADIKGLDDLNYQRKVKHVIKRALYRALKEKINKNTPWGMLTGIRPTKKVYELCKEKDEAINILIDEYFVREDKAHLAMDIIDIQEKAMKPVTKNSLSIYADIPFCPTRCIYCSFTSNSISAHGHMVEPYLNALEKEIKYCGEGLKKKDTEISSIYIGGGTPTSINAMQLDRLLSAFRDNFSLNNCEFTVEAGRPDTIDEEKLRILKGHGVNRISINPQTMNNETLKLIGRRHTPEDIIEKYNMARKIGFDCINMDIIIGLPGENSAMVENTMKEIEKLDIDNLTIHNMALKRASELNQGFSDYYLSDELEIERMFDFAVNYSLKMGFKPYYMYRQKNMIGNLENIGLCKDLKLCFYNVVMMEERQQILALGAGAVSKLIDTDKEKIDRIFNVKGMYDYVNRIDEMIERKKEFFQKY